MEHVLSIEERLGCTRATRNMQRFKEWAAEIGLSMAPLSIVLHFLHSMSKSKLQMNWQCLWMLKHLIGFSTQLEGVALPDSDHCPFFWTCVPYRMVQPPSRFENMWLSQTDFNSEVKELGVLRQGDSLSLFFFILVADSFSWIINKGVSKGLIRFFYWIT